MQLVQHHAAEVPEELFGVVIGQQEGEGLRRGQKDVGWLAPLALALGLGRVSSAGLAGDLKAHLLDRRQQVAVDVDRQRLQGRQVERVQSGTGLGAELDQGGQEARQGLAAAGGGDQQRRLSGLGGLHHRQLMAARRPAARFEPAIEDLRQAGAALRVEGKGGHVT